MQYLLLPFREWMKLYSSEDRQETKSKRTHTAFLKIFIVVHEQKNEKCPRSTNIFNYLTRFDNSSIFVVKYPSFTKFSIRWPVSKLIL